MAAAFVPGAGGLVMISRGVAQSSAASLAHVRCRAASRAAPVLRRAFSCAAPSRARRPPLSLHPLVDARIRRPPAMCQSPETPESPLEPQNVWQKLKQAWKCVSWKHVFTLLLLLGCTAVGYFANREHDWAVFIVDVLDKANKTYKPTLEFGILVVAIIISLSSR